jgi:hypothetical protein
LWNRLLTLLGQEARRANPLADVEIAAIEQIDDNPWRAHALRERIGETRFTSFIRETFCPEDARSDEFHEDLLKLPFAHVLTVNYDAVLETAHVRATGWGSHPERVGHAA